MTDRWNFCDDLYSIFSTPFLLPSPNKELNISMHGMPSCVIICWSYKLLISNQWTVKLSLQDGCIVSMTYKPSKLGQTGLVFGL